MNGTRHASHDKRWQNTPAEALADAEEERCSLHPYHRYFPPFSSHQLVQIFPWRAGGITHYRLEDKSLSL